MITTQATLVKKYDAPSGEVSLVTFQLESMCSFQEWQFMMISKEINGTVIKRPYSIASTAQQLLKEKTMSFYVKKASEKGMSARLTQGIKLGDIVTLQWPVWHYIDNKIIKNYLFISTGSGISPNLGIFQSLIMEEQQAYNNLVFLFGERTYAHIIPEVEQTLYAHNKLDITVQTHLTQEKKVWYLHGRVQQSIPEAIKKTSTDVQVFLCGSPTMVQETKQLLIEQWISSKSITIEKW